MKRYIEICNIEFAGANVQYCRSPYGEDEVFILCRSQGRKEKEQAILERFIRNIEEGLAKMRAASKKVV